MSNPVGKLTPIAVRGEDLRPVGKLTRVKAPVGNLTPLELFEEAVARENRAMSPQFDEAMFWAEKYNADITMPLSERLEAFNRKQNLSVLPSTTQAIQSAVASKAFEVEMKSRNLTDEAVITALENISKVETSGGRNNTISSGGAGGILQVIPSTFDDLLNRNVVGPKALKAIGKSKEELLQMSNKEKAEYLRDDNVAAAIFGLGAFLNKMERPDES